MTTCTPSPMSGSALPGPGAGVRRLPGWGCAAVRGMSLVEILVALALGLFLLAGIIQVLVSGRATYRLAEAEARTQESGRYAIEYLARELRSGRSGLCRNASQDAAEPDSLTVLACALRQDPSTAGCSGSAVIGTGAPLGYSVAQFEAKDGSALAGLPGGSAGPAGSKVSDYRLRGDVLVSWGVTGDVVYAKPDMLRSAAAVDLAAPVKLIDGYTATELASAGFAGGNMVMISDCGRTDIFTISNAGTAGTAELQHAQSRASGGKDSSKVNSSAELSFGYNDSASAFDRPRAFVAPYDLRVHFICCVDQQTGLMQSGSDGLAKCTGGSEVYHAALCRWSANSGTAQPVVMDVADLRATFDGRVHPASTTDLTRFSQSTDPQTAATINTAKRWANVYSTRVELLVSGGDAVRASAQAPVTAATKPDQLGYKMPEDQRLYRIFSATIANRARTLWYRDQ